MGIPDIEYYLVLFADC